MKPGFWLSDQQWALIEPHLPSRAGGRRRVDDRRVVSGIVPVLRSGCRWRDCLAEYGRTRRFTIAMIAGPEKASGGIRSRRSEPLRGPGG